MLLERKQLHLEHFDYSDPNTVFFITICTNNKKPYFHNPDIIKIVLDEIYVRSKVFREVSIFAYCIMPDHLHLLLKLREEYGRTLQNWVGAFKRFVSRWANWDFGIKPFWQKNFYEHVVRKEESLEKIAEYIVHNPVRKGLVDDWQKYPYSKIDFTDF